MEKDNKKKEPCILQIAKTVDPLLWKPRATIFMPFTFYSLTLVSFFLFRSFAWTIEYGRGTKLGTIKCRTTDISEFQNYEYYSMILFTNSFSIIFFKLPKHKVLDNFSKFEIFSKLLNSGNFIIFQIHKIKQIS